MAFASISNQIGVARPAAGSWGALSTISKIEVICLTLILFCFPIAYYLERYLSLPSQLLTVPYRAAISVSLLLIILMAKRYRYGATNWPVVMMAGFLACYSLRLVVDLYVNQVYTAFPKILYFVFFFGLVCASSVAFSNYRESLSTSLSTVYRWGVHLSAIGCLVAIYYSRGLLGAEFGRLRADGGINPIILGHMGVTLILLLVAHAIYVKRSSFQRAMTTSQFATTSSYYALGLVTIALASSRSPVVALLLCLSLMLISSRNFRVWAIAGFVCALLLIFQETIFEYVHQSGSSILLRIEQSIRENETGSRIQIWTQAIDYFSVSPLLGYSAFQEGSYPHNLVVEAYMATGVFGGTLFLLPFLYALIRGVSLLRGEPALATTYIIFVQYSVVGMFSGAIWGSTTFWALFALVLAAIPVSSAQRKRSDQTVALASRYRRGNRFNRSQPIRRLPRG